MSVFLWLLVPSQSIGDRQWYIAHWCAHIPVLAVFPPHPSSVFLICCTQSQIPTHPETHYFRDSLTIQCSCLIGFGWHHFQVTLFSGRFPTLNVSQGLHSPTAMTASSKTSSSSLRVTNSTWVCSWVSELMRFLSSCRDITCNL